MTERDLEAPLAKVYSLDAARQRRDLGLKALEAAGSQPLPPYLDVQLGNEPDAPSLRAWIVPDSPTAYLDALRYGKDTQATVLWGRIRPQRLPVDPINSRKLAVIFDHDTIPDYAGMQMALQAVADQAGPGLRFDINEHYHQESWRSVTLPELPAQQLAA